MAKPTIKTGRTFALPINRVAADEVTAVDWPAGTLTSEVRDRNETLIATFTVDDTNRLAVDGGEIVLRLTDEQTAELPAPLSCYCDVKGDDTGVLLDIVPRFAINIESAVTQ